MVLTKVGGLKDQGNRFRLLENSMIVITFILNVIDYDYKPDAFYGMFLK
jgi:hypothetical protein